MVRRLWRSWEAAAQPACPSCGRRARVVRRSRGSASLSHTPIAHGFHRPEWAQSSIRRLPLIQGRKHGSVASRARPDGRVRSFPLPGCSAARCLRCGGTEHCRSLLAARRLKGQRRRLRQRRQHRLIESLLWRNDRVNFVFTAAAPALGLSPRRPGSRWRRFLIRCALQLGLTGPGLLKLNSPRQGNRKHLLRPLGRQTGRMTSLSFLLSLGSPVVISFTASKRMVKHSTST